MTPTRDYEKCCNLICKPCGVKYGGCTEHEEHPGSGPQAEWAGLYVDKREWGTEKEKWKAKLVYYTEEPMKRMRKEGEWQMHLQRLREDERDWQQF